MKSHSQEVGDGVGQRLEVNFKKKETSILLERQNVGVQRESIDLLFSGVELQEFKEFGDVTILADVEEASDAAEFWRGQMEYLNRMTNYLSSGLLEAIKANQQNRYFEISASYGFQGFVICKDLRITTQAHSC